MGLKAFSALQFDFKKYDIGGSYARKGDFKLTGDEVKKARQDGWDIQEGSVYTMVMGTPKRLKEDSFVFAPCKLMTKPQAEDFLKQHQTRQRKQLCATLATKAQSYGIPYNASDFNDLIEDRGVKATDIQMEKGRIRYKTSSGESNDETYSNGKLVKYDNYSDWGANAGIMHVVGDITYPQNGKYSKVLNKKAYIVDDDNGTDYALHSAYTEKYDKKGNLSDIRGVTYYVNDIVTDVNGVVEYSRKNKLQK